MHAMDNYKYKSQLSFPLVFSDSGIFLVGLYIKAEVEAENIGKNSKTN
jgi:hypothetical protein